MTKLEQAIMAMKHTGTTGKYECHRAECPYYLPEDVTGTKFEKMADYEEGGRKWVDSCDIDRIQEDAIKILEKVKELTK